MTDLGTLGGSLGSANGINDEGDIVGMATLAGGQEHAFLYSNGAMRDLNDLIEPHPGWVLEEAHAINNRGQIVGEGTFGGQTRAFLLTPLYTLTVANGTGSGTYPVGEAVPITARSLRAYAFERWTGDTTNVADPDAESTTVTMVQDTTLTATYGEFGSPIRAVAADAGPDARFTVDWDATLVDVELDGSGSVSNLGLPLQYKWVEDGHEIASGPNQAMRLDPHAQIVVLEVTDSAGNWDIDVTVIQPERAILRPGIPPTQYTFWLAPGSQVVSTLLDGTEVFELHGSGSVYQWIVLPRISDIPPGPNAIVNLVAGGSYIADLHVENKKAAVKGGNRSESSPTQTGAELWEAQAQVNSCAEMAAQCGGNPVLADAQPRHLEPDLPRCEQTVKVHLSGSRSVSRLKLPLLRFSWTENGREIGTGAEVDLDLGPGRHPIVLEVSDSHGNIGAAPSAIVVKQDANAGTSCNTVCCNGGGAGAAFALGLGAMTLLRARRTLRRKSNTL
jgi:probable HAF family extracellular repeat protein